MCVGNLYRLITTSVLLIIFVTLMLMQETFSLIDENQFIYSANITVDSNVTTGLSGFGGEQYIYVKSVLNSTVTHVFESIREDAFTVNIRGVIYSYNIDVKTNMNTSVEQRIRDLNESLKRGFGHVMGLRSLFAESYSIIPPDLLLLPEVPLHLWPDPLTEARLNTTIVNAKLVQYMDRLTLYVKRFSRFTNGNPMGEKWLDAREEVEDYIDLSGVRLLQRINIELGLILGEVKLKCRVRAEATLKNPNSLGNVVALTNALRFRDGDTSLYVYSVNPSVNFKVNANKLILNVSGEGLGVVFLKLPKTINITEAYVDGVKTYFVEIMGSNERYTILPIKLTSRIVEIRFNQELMVMQQTTQSETKININVETKKTAPILIVTSILVIVASASILMILRKTQIRL